MYIFLTFSVTRLESDEEAGEQLIADIFGASDEEEEFVVRYTGCDHAYNTLYYKDVIMLMIPFIIHCV